MLYALRGLRAALGVVAIAAFLTGALLPAAADGTVTPKDALTRLFTVQPVDEAWFTGDLMREVPISKMRTIVGDTLEEMGPLKSVLSSGDFQYTLVFQKGTVRAKISLSSDSISGLLLFGYQSEANKARLAALFATDPIPEKWFAPSFLAEAPIGEVRRTVKALKSGHGPVASISPRDDGYYDVVFAKGSVPAAINLDPDGRIGGLLFRTPTPEATK